VLVKPVSADLPMNNIVIATDRRTYHIEAHPTRETYMAAVSWRYPQDEFVALRRQNAEAERRANVTAAGGLDVSSLRFRYRISGDSPPWRPVQAFDDGHKVYIQFPPGIAQGESRVTGRGGAPIRNSDGGGSLRGGPMSLIDHPFG
jgi:type IV secretion system protein TrbG